MFPAAFSPLFLRVFAAALEGDQWVEKQMTSGVYLARLLAVTGG